MALVLCQARWRWPYACERVSAEARRGRGPVSSDTNSVAAGCIEIPVAGIFLTSSRAIRQAAWIIQETDRSCRMASFCVSASIAELKYSVTLRFCDTVQPVQSRKKSSPSC